CEFGANRLLNLTRGKNYCSLYGRNSFIAYKQELRIGALVHVTSPMLFRTQMLAQNIAYVVLCFLRSIGCFCWPFAGLDKCFATRAECIYGACSIKIKRTFLPSILIYNSSHFFGFRNKNI